MPEATSNDPQKLDAGEPAARRHLVSPAQYGDYKKYVLAERKKLTRRLLVERPNISLAELNNRLAAKQIETDMIAVSRLLRQQGVSYRKNVRITSRAR